MLVCVFQKSAIFCILSSKVAKFSRTQSGRSPGHRGTLDQRREGWSALSRQGRYVRETQEGFSERNRFLVRHKVADWNMFVEIKLQVVEFGVNGLYGSL